MKDAEPTTTEPAGQDRPFDRQNVTESAGAARSDPAPVEPARARMGEVRAQPREAVGGTEPRPWAEDRQVEQGRGVGDRVDRAVGVQRDAPGVDPVDGVAFQVGSLEIRPDEGDPAVRADPQMGAVDIDVDPADRRWRRRRAGGRHGHRRGRLAQQLSRAFLEGVDRRVLAPHVVTDLGGGHRAAHLCGRLGHGVGAQVEHGHGRRV